MGILTEISRKYNTDKRPEFHNYVSFYEKYFNDIRNDVINVLEIGIGPVSGASLKMWEEYFPNANIYGVDIFEYGHLNSGRITTRRIDQGNKEEMVSLCKNIGKIDIIIEDGSHMQHHQQQNLAWLFPFVKAGGYFVIEDLYFSYNDEAQNKRLNDSDDVSLRVILDFINTGRLTSGYISSDEASCIERETEFCRIENGIYYDFRKSKQIEGVGCECAIFKKRNA